MNRLGRTRGVLFGDCHVERVTESRWQDLRRLPTSPENGGLFYNRLEFTGEFADETFTCRTLCTALSKTLGDHPCAIAKRTRSQGGVTVRFSLMQGERQTGMSAIDDEAGGSTPARQVHHATKCRQSPYRLKFLNGRKRFLTVFRFAAYDKVAGCTQNSAQPSRIAG